MSECVQQVASHPMKVAERIRLAGWLAGGLTATPLQTYALLRQTETSAATF